MMSWMKEIFRAQTGRQVYVICTMFYLVVYGLLVGLLPAFPASLLLPPVWIVFVAMPRLRDMRRSIWWALGPFAVGFVGGVVGVIERRSGGLAEGAVGPAQTGVSVLAMIASLALIVWLGIAKSRTVPTQVFD